MIVPFLYMLWAIEVASLFFIVWTRYDQMLAHWRTSLCGFIPGLVLLLVENLYLFELGRFPDPGLQVELLGTCLGLLLAADGHAAPPTN